MKIKELLEAEVKPYSVETVEVEKLKTLLTTYCSQAVKSFGETPLYRGMRGNLPDAIMIDPAAGERKSENTTNHYTLIMDNSPYMKGWPKRSKSLICSTDPIVSSGYGNVYAIYPVDNTKIAVCPYADMWNTNVIIPEIAVGEYQDLEGLNDKLDILGVPDTSYADMVNYINSEDFVRKYNEQANMRRYPARLENPSDLLSILQMKLSPKNANFSLYDVKDFPKSVLKDDRECWFSGKCVAIKKDTVYQELLTSGFFNK